jgi:hypothetical protein
LFYGWALVFLPRVGLHQLFGDSSIKQSAAWSSAIGAASSIASVLVTIALAVVTTVYVVFTRQVVRLQGTCRLLPVRIQGNKQLMKPLLPLSTHQVEMLL